MAADITKYTPKEQGEIYKEIDNRARCANDMMESLYYLINDYESEYSYGLANTICRVTETLGRNWMGPIWNPVDMYSSIMEEFGGDFNAYPIKAHLDYVDRCKQDIKTREYYKRKLDEILVEKGWADKDETGIQYRPVVEEEIPAFIQDVLYNNREYELSNRITSSSKFSKMSAEEKAAIAKHVLEMGDVGFAYAYDVSKFIDTCNIIPGTIRLQDLISMVQKELTDDGKICDPSEIAKRFMEKYGEYCLAIQKTEYEHEVLENISDAADSHEWYLKKFGAENMRGEEYTEADFNKSGIRYLTVNDVYVHSSELAFDEEGFLFEKKSGRPVVWEGMAEEPIQWTVDEFVKECKSWEIDHSVLTDDYEEKVAQRKCDVLVSNFLKTTDLSKDEMSIFNATRVYISCDEHYPAIEQLDVLRGWIDGYNIAKSREKPLSDKIKAADYDLDHDYFGQKKLEKSKTEFLKFWNKGVNTSKNGSARYEEGIRAGYGNIMEEMYRSRDEEILDPHLAKSTTQQDVVFKEETIWSKNLSYDFKKDEIGQEALDNYFGDIPEDVADYAETEEANKMGFKDGYMAAMERMLGENQKLREQLEQAQQKAASLDALNYAIENHPDERLAETVSKNAGEMIKWANYTMEHGHVQAKTIDTKSLVVLPMEPMKLKPGQAKETILSDFKLDGLKDVASTLEERYRLFDSKSMCAIACEPTAEGIVTYMSAVREVFDKSPELSVGAPIPRVVHDANTLINDDIEAVQQIADEVEMNRFYKEKEMVQEQAEPVQNIEKDDQEIDEGEKDNGSEFGDD